MAKSRLDTDHGFMKFIVKNQVDRDKYDKEVKAKKAASTKLNISTRPKKPDIRTYVPRSKRHDNGNRIILFRMEYEDQHREVHSLNIFHDDDPVLLARRFGHGQNMTAAMIRALSDVLQQEIHKRQQSDDS